MRLHYKSDWHKLNIQRKHNNNKSLTLIQFEELVNNNSFQYTSSIFDENYNC